MYICICKGVTDKHIKAAVENGAQSLKDLNQEFGLAGQCGKCSKAAKVVLNRELQAMAHLGVRVA